MLAACNRRATFLGKLSGHGSDGQSNKDDTVTDSAQRDAFWSRESDQLLAQLATSAAGLTQSAAADRASRATRLTPRRPTAWSLLIEQFRSPILVLLFCSALLSFTLLDDKTNATIIVAILIASGLLGFWQELSAADAVAKLMSMIETKATVVRDGQDHELPLAEIVPGDIVRLRAGDLIPGDCRLLTARDLFLNEAVLTGESFPAEKAVAVLPEQTPLGQRTNSVFLGTNVISGLATAVVVGTGRDTEFGRISERLQHKPPETGFERGLRHFGQLLIRIVLVITVVVFAIKVGVQGKPVTESLLVGLALAVGMTPQLLPAITSVVLAAGAKSMARHQVIVKQLLSIENLGGMTVLCSDKTGTLTNGVVQLHETLDVAGQPSDRVARLAFWNAFFQSGFANPIDRAICDRQQFDMTGVEKLDEIPYDFVRKRLSVRVHQNGEKLLITKGALAHVLDCCSQAETSSGELVDLDSRRDDIDRRFSEMSQQGHRVLGLAARTLETPHITKDDEQKMTFLGFLVFADLPKDDAKETLDQLRDLGVALKIITGDNHAVATTVSRRVGIESPSIVTGAELRTLSDEALRRRAHDADVFAEVEPNQKERIILALKHSGHVVGYLGDGINDASALHAADVGISVASAVDVAREAAQIVLLRQDLRVLVQGVREGRQTFSNTLKYVFFAIAANFGYMFSLAVASLFLPFEPLLASQILLVNLLADFPAMALATDSVDPEQIQRPRRWDVRFIVRFMMSFGFASSMFDFLTFGAMYYFFSQWRTTVSPVAFEQLFQTGWFVESTLTGLMILLVIRTQRPIFLSRPGRWFLVTESCIAVVTVLLPYSPLAKSLGFVTPPPMLVTIALIIALLYGAGMEAVKRVFYRFTP
jgi:Mg2+-importing ATPase